VKRRASELFADGFWAQAIAGPMDGEEAAKSEE
jgi:hypothetical protein